MRKSLKKKLALHKETLNNLDLAAVEGGVFAPPTFTCDTYYMCSDTCTGSFNAACQSQTCYTTSHIATL
jgi:hypothetical protein